MDLNEYLQEIAVSDSNTPWAIIISQIVFDCFRKYCLEFIKENELTPWENIYELCEICIEDTFKPYLGEIFQVEHYEEFKNEDLCIAFFKKFLNLLKETIDKKYIDEDILTDFLDHNIYVYFETLLSESDYYIFPKDFEGVLDITKYESIRETLFEKKEILPSEELNEPIITKDIPIKSITIAILKKRLGIKYTRKSNISTKTFVFAKTHKNKNRK